MFAIHLCTHDMKKALAALRRNGVEVLAILQHVCCQLFTLSTQVATLYDQNHIDNHKNSMVGQCVLMELQQGDRVQVLYYYTTLLHYCITVFLYYCISVVLYCCISVLYLFISVWLYFGIFSVFLHFGISVMMVIIRSFITILCRCTSTPSPGCTTRPATI